MDQIEFVVYSVIFAPILIGVLIAKRNLRRSGFAGLGLRQDSLAYSFMKNRKVR